MTISEATLQTVLQPIDKASGLPNEAYTSDAFLTLERDQEIHLCSQNVG